MAGITEILEKEGAYLEFEKMGTRYDIETIKGTPCRVACPTGVNVKAYLGLIASGKFEQALEVVKRTNPLPGICGRVCTYPCEADCRRGDIDNSVTIRILKRFIADYELKNIKKLKLKIDKKVESIDYKKKYVAIVGSGPAGLTAANDLIRLGYGVTIFETLAIPGGMLSVGIPSYRLPRDVIGAEIKSIKNLGVKIKTNTKIKDVDKLFKNGYNAVFLAIGAHKGLKLNIPGEDEFEGIVDCISFLKKVNLGDKKNSGKKVIVIGGGNAAIDSARTSLRLGVDEVTIVYRRSKKEMPADKVEIYEAEFEGVKINFLAAPVKILGKNGKVVGMECIKMRLGEPDKSGRRRPIPIKGTEFTIKADMIISAISQKPDLDFLPKNHGFNISKWDSFEVDSDTLTTNKKGVFAGGDAVTGPNTVIDAISDGHKAAHSINNFLSGKKAQTIEPEELILERRLNIAIGDWEIEKKEYIPISKLSRNKRRISFDEVEKGITEEQAIEEAKRCLRCGPCIECVECSTDCNKKLIVLSSPENPQEDILLRVPWVPERFPSAKGPWHGTLCFGRKKLPVILESVLSDVREEFCRGCGKCVEICEYNAIELIEKRDGIFVAEIDTNFCRGCGTCASVCPSSAIISNHFTDSWMNNIIEYELRKI